MDVKHAGKGGMRSRRPPRRPHAARVQPGSKSSGAQRAAQAARRRLASADADEELSSYMEHRLSRSGSRRCAPGRACSPASSPCAHRGGFCENSEQTARLAAAHAGKTASSLPGPVEHVRLKVDQM